MCSVKHKAQIRTPTHNPEKKGEKVDELSRNRWCGGGGLYGDRCAKSFQLSLWDNGKSKGRIYCVIESVATVPSRANIGVAANRKEHKKRFFIYGDISWKCTSRTQAIFICFYITRVETRRRERGLDSRLWETRPLTFPSKLCNTSVEGRGKYEKTLISDKDQAQCDSRLLSLQFWSMFRTCKTLMK